MFTRSTTPSSLSSSPIGISIITALRPSFSMSWSFTLYGLAPVLSHLLTNAIRGTWYLFIWRSTVMDCDCTPPTEQSTRMAPSRTLKDLSTSIVKSTWPGVSMTLISCPFHITFVAAEAMVIPLSLSSSMESMVAPTPSLPRTSWIAWILLQ